MAEVQQGAEYSRLFRTATDLNWQGALQYCRNLTLAGKSWRLPSVNELKSIVDYSKYNPAINTAFFPNTQADHYWSSSTYVSNAGTRGSSISATASGNDDKTTIGSVRCVADGP